MSDTAARLLRLLSLLQLPRDWSGPQLADRLGVTVRTVRTDVNRLRELGYPVHATRGSAGSYRLGAGATVPPLLLDDDEAVAVGVGLRSAATAPVSGIEEAALRALTKLEQVLPARLRRRVAALQSAVLTIPPDTPAPVVSADLLTAIAAACRDHYGLRFDYRAHDEATSRRAVEPLRMVVWGRRWFLVAWDIDRADWRTFRVDRIALRSPDGPRFTPRQPPASDLAAYVARGVSAAAWRHTARLRVHAPAAEVARRVPAGVGPIETLDADSCLLTGGGDTIDSLALSVCLLDADVEVLDNPQLRARLSLLGDRLTRAARTG